MEVYFRSRGDYAVIHEPFGDTYWQDADPQTAKNSLLQDIQNSDLPVFVKDIAHHVPQPIVGSPDFVNAFTHVIVLRSPLATFHSHLAVNPEVKSHEFGYIALYETFDRIRELTGKTPKLILADQLLEDPEMTVRDLCEALHIDHLPEALSWEPKHQTDWSVGDKWQIQAGKSSGFEKRQKVKLEPVPESLLDIYEQHQQCYIRLIEETCIEDV